MLFLTGLLLASQKSSDTSNTTLTHKILIYNKGYKPRSISTAFLVVLLIDFILLVLGVGETLMVELLLDETEHGSSFFGRTVQKLFYFSVDMQVIDDS